MKFFQYAIIVLFFNTASAQLIDNYITFSKKNLKIGEYHFKDSKYSISQKIQFLGKITAKDKHVLKVFTSHKNLGGKGVNDLIFISEKNVQYIYRLNVPSDFPLYSSKNKLYFKDGKDVVAMAITELREVFCTPFECFE